jgi:transcription termination factor NusB
MARDVPWDAQTDAFVSDLNSIISKKYSVSFRSMLLNPDAYVKKKDIADTVKKVKAEVNSYFSQLLANLKDEQSALGTELAKKTDQYKKVDSVVSTKSSVLRIPYVKPLFISRNPDNEETILVEQYDSGLDALIGKLVGASNYVADLSATYKENRLGSWLFSGAKNYVLTINPPTSPVLAIDNSSTLINAILDSISRG